MNNGDLRHYMKVVQNESHKSNGRHLSDDELMTLLQQGDLREDERVSLRAHLVECSQCIDTFKEMRDFLADDSPAQPQVDEIAKERVWRAVRPQSVADKSPKTTRRRPIIAHAVAACLAIMFIIAGILAINLWQQKQFLLSQLQNEQKQNAEIAEKIKALEGQQQPPQVPPATPNTDTERQVAKLKEPSINTLILDVFPTDSTERGSGSGSNTPTIPSTAKNFVLLLNAAGRPQYPNYQVEILDGNNKTVWTSAGLKRDNLGNFSLSLTKDFLPRGGYRLRVYGISGQKRQHVADYSVRVN